MGHKTDTNELTNNCHSLKDAVNILQALEELLHHVRLVEVGAQRDEDLLVDEHQLPQLRHLALDVPHEGLVEELDSVGPEHLRQGAQLRRVSELLRVEGDGALSAQRYKRSKVYDGYQQHQNNLLGIS